MGCKVARINKQEPVSDKKSEVIKYFKIVCNLTVNNTLYIKMNGFKKFYSDHKEQLFSYLMRLTGNYYLSGDILQESFTRYLENYGNKTNNVALLYKIARNVFLDIKRRKRHDSYMDGDHEDLSRDQEHDLMIRQEYKEVLSAIQRLDKDERDILALTLSRDLKYKDIANMIGISEGAIKVKVHRARVKLKEMLKKGES